MTAGVRRGVKVQCPSCDDKLVATSVTGFFGAEDYFEDEDDRTRMGNIHTVGPNQALIVSGE